MTATSQKEACHIVLRFQRYVHYEGRKLDVIQEHNDIFDRDGQVTLAKFGRNPAASKVERLRLQIERGQRTNLFLVCRDKKEFQGFSCTIATLSTTEATAECPEYYNDVELDPGLWITLDSAIKPASLKGLRLVLNQKPLLDVLAECRTSMMLVSEV